jgi:hypothetical protein
MSASLSQKMEAQRAMAANSGNKFLKVLDMVT